MLIFLYEAAVTGRLMGTSIKSGYFRLHSELFISRRGSHVIASITKILNAEMDDFGGEMIIHDLIEVPLNIRTGLWD